MTSWRIHDTNLPQSELTTLMGQWNSIQHCKKYICVSHIPLAQPLLSTSVTWRHHDVISAKAQGGNLGTFSILFRMVLRSSTPPILNFQLSTNFFQTWPKNVPVLLVYLCTIAIRRTNEVGGHIENLESALQANGHAASEAAGQRPLGET